MTIKLSATVSLWHIGQLNSLDLIRSNTLYWYLHNTACLWALESDHCTTEFLEQINNENKCNCLLEACKRDSNVVKLILESKFCTKKLFTAKIKLLKWNILMTACYNQPDAIQYILESRYYTTELFESSNDGWNSFMILCQCYPKYLKLFLNHDILKISSNVTTQFCINDLPERLQCCNVANRSHTFLHILAIFQPEHIIEICELFKDVVNKIMDVIDGNENKFYAYLLPEYEHVLEHFYPKDSEEYRKYLKESKVHGISNTECGICMCYM